MITHLGYCWNCCPAQAIVPAGAREGPPLSEPPSLSQGRGLGSSRDPQIAYSVLGIELAYGSQEPSQELSESEHSL